VQQPTLRDDALSTNEDSLVTTTAQALFGNDTSVATASGPLRIIGLNREGTIGHPDFSSDGVVAYDPRGRFDRLAEGEIAFDTFRYEVDCGNGSTTLGTVGVTVTGRNDAPTAVADFEAVAANAGHVMLDVLANDGDVDSDGGRANLHIVAAEAASGAEVTFSGQPEAGIVYRPDGRFVSLGTNEAIDDVITYTVADRHGALATATVTVKVSGVNDAPLAHDDHALTDEDNAVVISVLANDTDPDTKDILRVSKVEGVTQGAMVTLREDGRLVYDPGSAFNHLGAGQTATDSFRYEIDDGHGGKSAASVTVTVSGRNDAPTAAADQATTGEQTQLTLTAAALLANDSDPDDGDTLRLIGVDGDGARGAVTLQDGAITYDPSGRFAFLGEGETATDTFHYSIADGAGASAIGSVSVRIVGVNDAVDARDDTFATGEDTRLTVATPGVLANDVDPDVNDKHTVIAVDGLAANVGRPITLASGAQLTLNASGSLVYDPGTTWNFLSAGEQRFETIGYTVSDGHGSRDSAQVTITINGVNDLPSAVADDAVTDEDAKRRIAVLANDSDPDAGDRLSLRTVILQGPDGTPTLGSVRINSDNTLTYDPEGRFDRLLPGETATDTFQYVVEDGHGGRATSTVTVTIHGVENPQPTPAQELLDSFDDPLVTPFSIQGLTAHFELRGAGALEPTFVPMDGLGRDLTALHATHLGQMAVLEASGSSAPSIESFCRTTACGWAATGEAAGRC
jgi:VCBS repeat-containing protein